MTTSPQDQSVSSAPGSRVPLRLALRSPVVPGQVGGAWWPQSRDLQTEAADLVDSFPAESGRVNRLLFSRPDWDDVVHDGHGTRRIQAARGAVKTGSFPGDDTHEIVLSLASGTRLRLLVVPSDTDPAEAERAMGSDGVVPEAATS